MDDFLLFDLPTVKYEQLPLGMIFNIKKFSFVCENRVVYAHTSDFKCILPNYLSAVFLENEDFWLSRKNVTLVYEGEGLLIIRDNSTDPRPDIRCLSIPKWTYYDVVDFDLFSITTPYFRCQFQYGISHFDSLQKVNFWKTRVGLKVSFEDYDLHFHYNSGDPTPFLEISELPCEKHVKYEIEKFERGLNNSTIIHTRYFSCKLPENQNDRFNTQRKLDFWNSMSDLDLSFFFDDEDHDVFMCVCSEHSMNGGKFLLRYYDACEEEF